jgi:hypothetical protein
VPAALIYTMCSDQNLHWSRLESRHREIDGFLYEDELTWDALRFLSNSHCRF